MQLYVNQNKDITKRIVQHAEERGVKGLFITVDAPQLGRREKVRFFAKDEDMTYSWLTGYEDEI
jgi:L-lactate dehydrogenase (cytochrome)